MSAPPNIKRIRVEDFAQDEQDLISKLAYSINSFMDDVVRILDGNIDIYNLSQNVRDITVKTDSSGNALNTPIKVDSGIEGRKVQGIICIQHNGKLLAGGVASVDSLPAFEFSLDAQIIKINKIIGLPADSEFKLRLLLIPENN